ncbi:MAG: putative mitochondrial protein, conserved [Alyxoria varia]|nr:MAG: putative mitochondrial protein, conserved [Alyxoria varia]
MRLNSVLSRSCVRYLSSGRLARSSWSPGPAPPRLPKEEQDIFEQLQKQSTGAFSTPKQPPQINQSPQTKLSDMSTSESTSANMQNAHGTPRSNRSIRANVKSGDELHPNVRRGAPPEFEGDINPKTGEVGGPKNEPLRWGGLGDWSYNGRASDF